MWRCEDEAWGDCEGRDGAFAVRCRENMRYEQQVRRGLAEGVAAVDTPNTRHALLPRRPPTLNSNAGHTS